MTEAEEGGGDEEEGGGDGDPEPDADPVGDEDPDFDAVGDEDPDFDAVEDGDPDFEGFADADPDPDGDEDGGLAGVTGCGPDGTGSVVVNADGLKNADGPWIIAAPIWRLRADADGRAVTVTTGVGAIVAAPPACGWACTAGAVTPACGWVSISGEGAAAWLMR